MNKTINKTIKKKRIKLSLENKMLICRGKLLHNKTIDALAEEFGCERSTYSK